MLINIYSNGKYPANVLSNFAANEFDFAGYKQILCMESFLQSLKFEDSAEQQRVLYMTAKEAKVYGSAKSWNKFLYWEDKKVDRFSKAYRSLLEDAYRSMLVNPKFKQALIDSRRNLFFYTMGKTVRRNTVLTWWEFVWILYKLRKDVRRNG